MPKLRDPAFDPMIAPTSAGLHPHLLRSGEERGGEHAGYESHGVVNAQLQARDAQLAVVKRSLGDAQNAAPAAAGQAGILDWAAQHPFIVAGALLGAAWLYKKGLEDSEGEPVRDNPAPAAASMAPVVVMAPLAGAQTPLSAQTQISEPEKKQRRRRTSQARDARGHYLPAGTRAKAVTEGK